MPTGKRIEVYKDHYDGLVEDVERMADELDRLTREVAELKRERDEYREIVEKLPKTADGVPVVPGDTVWFAADDSQFGKGPHECEVKPFWEWSSDQDQWEDSEGVWCGMVEANGVGKSLGDCYSTREAAEAAMKEADDA